MTRYYCMNCGELLFDNGDDLILGIYDDVCLKCKYLKEDNQK